MDGKGFGDKNSFYQSLEENSRRLYDLALAKAKEAYAPYSGFQVGAALLCEDGSVYEGVNIENASFGAGICAERTAACCAIARGKRRFTAIAVAALKEGKQASAPPCGICRQFLGEFGQELLVIFGKDREHLQRYPLQELLPRSFQLEEKP